jgi:hypothetical protein
MSFTNFKTTVLFLIFSFVVAGSLFSTKKVSAQQGEWTLNAEYEVSSKYLVVGDRVDVTLKVTLKDGKPMTQERTARFSIRNPKQGQTCETTDDNFKDDGQIKGFCEAKGEPGNMEIGVSVDQQATFVVDDTRYNPYIFKTYNAMFNDPKDSCQNSNQAPSSFQLIKQNDVTVDAKWQHDEKFIGYYEVLYGTTLGEYPSKKKTEEKSTVVDNLDSSKEYYFKVRATSACKTVTYSPVLKYSPRTGAVAVTSEKAAGSPSPSPSSSPKIKPSPSVSPELSATSSAEPVMETTESSPQPSSSPTTNAKDKKNDNSSMLGIALIGGAVVLLIGAGGIAYALNKKKADSIVEG